MMFALDILNLDKDISNMIKRKDTFQLIETSYTARIKQERNGRKNTFLYSAQDKKLPPVVLKKYNDFLLLNINKVRSLAKDFELKDAPKEYIDLGWSSMLSSLPREITIWCVDIKSAYFNAAIEIGLFTKEFVLEFEKYFEIQFKQIIKVEKDYNDLYKSARLVVLGSCATKRRVRDYVEGICKEDSGYKVYDVKARNVYVEVCRSVDNLMIELNEVPGTVGYYWDCVFTTSESSAIEVEKKILERGLNFKTEKRKSKIYYYPNGGGSMVTNCDNEAPIKKIYQFNYRKVVNYNPNKITKTTTQELDWFEENYHKPIKAYKV